MKPYSVLIKWPDYICTDGTHETYYDWVKAKSAKSAVKLVKKRMEILQPGNIHDPEDLLVLLVLAGHHEDLDHAKN